MDLDLRHLRTVAVIAETGNLTKAAAVLGLTQPALSSRLKRLEGWIGAPLFIRRQTGMELTAVGRFTLLRTRAILASVAELRRGALQFTHNVDPMITIGGSADSVLLGLADRLATHLPLMEAHILMEYSPVLLRDLVLAGRLDAATTVEYPGFPTLAHESLHSEVIAEEPVFIAISAADPLAERGAIDLADLARHRWAISPPDGAGWPDCFRVACAEHGFDPDVRYTTPNAGSIHALVTAGRVVSPVQPSYPADHLVAVRPLTGNPVVQRHVLLCPRDGVLTCQLGLLTELATEAYWSYVRDHTDHFALLRCGG
ncbi:LysR family transcriptional regulator [Actinokineospora fastidiosa]|uniref:LysR family transcriptional regulator n=1 Tax=Actinokineospora fastidiosa TaxID=1816 RepID=A0A918GQ69_9PSEU|nr:LysR family transcriptional regulator [Actinokineospora fastidiosa]GGS53953.1 LysR family transcriptional regulator [Actinokineospora fastidiosa]